MKFYNMLRKGSIKFPGKILISINEKVFTYKDVFEEVSKIRSEFNKLEIQGVKIGILNKDLCFQLIYFLGVLSSANIPIIIHENISSEVLNNLIDKESLHILRNRNLSNLKNINNINKHSRFNSNYFGVLSSGTMGVPKLILRNEESWIKSFNYQSELFNLRRESKVFIHGSLSFTANLNYVFHILSLGGSVSTTTSIMPGEWIKKIKDNNVNGIFLVPSRYKLLLKRCNNKLCFVESILSAGEKLNIEVAEKLSEIFNKAEIVEYYGSSETSYITYNKYDNITNNEKGVGYIFPGVKLNLENGEIFVESKYLAKGYESGFKVNDKGYINENGILCLSGRNGNIVNKGGVKININNIENILRSIKYIDDYVVFSLKDKIKGEDVFAIVILNDKSIREIEIVKMLKEKLNKNEIPRIKIIDDFPFNISGKIDINKLKQMI